MMIKGVRFINYEAPGKCPVCGHGLLVTRLSCSYCSTKLEGEFSTCKFCRLTAEQRQFIEVFIKCRGSIKDVEKELGISYPTVRNRLDAVVAALGYPIDGRTDTEETDTQAILDAVEKGAISVAEAARQLKKR